MVSSMPRKTGCNSRPAETSLRTSLVVVWDHFFRVFWFTNLLYTKVSHTVFLSKSCKVVFVITEPPQNNKTAITWIFSHCCQFHLQRRYSRPQEGRWCSLRPWCGCCTAAHGTYCRRIRQSCPDVRQRCSFRSYLPRYDTMRLHCCEDIFRWCQQ